jgi:hypothetical protein
MKCTKLWLHLRISRSLKCLEKLNETTTSLKYPRSHVGGNRTSNNNTEIPVWTRISVRWGGYLNRITVCRLQLNPPPTANVSVITRVSPSPSPTSSSFSAHTSCRACPFTSLHFTSLHFTSLPRAKQAHEKAARRSCSEGFSIFVAQLSLSARHADPLLPVWRRSRRLVVLQPARALRIQRPAPKP